MYKTALQNPVKLDVTYADDGTCVQWDGDQWLDYNSYEAKEFRNRCLEEFNKRHPFRKRYLDGEL